mgnify:CR=1 FL=1
MAKSQRLAADWPAQAERRLREGIAQMELSAEVGPDVLARLLTFPNVIITAHQAFLTREALAAIAATTLQNIADWAAGTPQNRVEG